MIYRAGPGTQPSSVIVSGVQYSQSIYFPAGSQSFTPVLIPSFMIDDDQVGLESLEEYQLMMTDASRILNVALGQPTTISIADDDGKINIGQYYHTMLLFFCSCICELSESTSRFFGRIRRTNYLFVTQ